MFGEIILEEENVPERTLDTLTENEIQFIEDPDKTKFTCEICHQDFNEKDAKNVHQLYEHYKYVMENFNKEIFVDNKDSTYYCARCMEGFETRERYKNHKEVCEPIRLTKMIEVLNTIAENRGKIMQNLNIKNEIINEKCPKCEESFKSDFDYWYHQAAKHQVNLYEIRSKSKGLQQAINMYCNYTKNDFKCQSMKYIIWYNKKKNGKYQNRLTRETLNFCKPHSIQVEKKFRCYECPNYYASKQNLLKHQKEHEVIEKNSTTSVQTNFKCDLCGKNLTALRSLKRHCQIVHEGKIQNPVTCTPCEKTFKTKQGLQKHVSTIHKNIKFKCNLCKKNFTRKQGLSDHTKRMHGSDGRKKRCQYCSKNYLNNSELRQHILVVHQKNDKMTKK